MRMLILVILSIFSIAIPPRAGADTGCQASESEIQDAIGEIHTKQSNVGLAAVIIRGDKLVFAEYLGLADEDLLCEPGTELQFKLQPDRCRD